MKKLFTIIVLLLYINAFGQMSIGGGFGFGDKTKFVAQLSLNWNVSHTFGIDGGFTASPSTNKPAFFHIQVYTPIINNEIWKVSPMGGYSYKLLNEDTKEPGINGGSWVAGLEAAKNINNMGVLYIRCNYTQCFSWVTVGVRGFLGKREYCY